jgi:hypothetical protein
MAKPFIRFSVIILKNLNIHHIMKTKKVHLRIISLSLMILLNGFSFLKAEAAPSTSSKQAPSNMVHVPSGKYLAGYLAERAITNVKRITINAEKPGSKTKNRLKKLK